MRITKKWLRDIKRGLNNRLNTLGKMSEAELMAELKRMWPEVNPVADSPQDAMRQMMAWAIEASIPSHIVD